jgi:hypothetical protein
MKAIALMDVVVKASTKGSINQATIKVLISQATIKVSINQDIIRDSSQGITKDIIKEINLDSLKERKINLSGTLTICKEDFEKKQNQMILINKIYHYFC